MGFPVAMIGNDNTALEPPLADLVLWLDASDDGSITESGGKVTEWIDRRGSGVYFFEQSVGASRPDRVTDGVQFTNPTSANSTVPTDTIYMVGGSASSFLSGVDIMYVAVLDTMRKTGAFEGAVITSNASATVYQDLRVGAGNASAEYRGSALGTATTGADWSGDQRHIVIAKFTGTSARSVAVDEGSFTTNTTAAGTPTGTINYLGIQRAPSGGNPAASLNAIVREILVYDPIPDSGTLADIIDYLQEKWF